MTDKEDGSSPVIYQIFGLDLISEYKFVSKMYRNADKSSSEDFSSRVFFTCSQFSPFSVDWENGELIYYWGYSTAEGVQWNKLYHFDTFDVFQFAWGADFYISTNHIDCHLRDPARRSLVELHLVGLVLAFWLERQGFPALHASAVEVDSRISAFLSHGGNGKSTLAAGFLRAGVALFTDDILPIKDYAGNILGRPGLPMINLWPDQAAYFMDNEEFEIVVPDVHKKRIPVEAFKNGAFCHESRPLACIYIPHKSEGPSHGADIEITPVPPAEAVIELVRYSFFPSMIFEKLGWQAPRLDLFARLVKQVPVRRLVYPAGFEHLSRVTEAVLQDLKNLPPQP
jgi:hypothetical protein